MSWRARARSRATAPIRVISSAVAATATDIASASAPVSPAGTSQPHLHRLFRRRFGRTPLQHFQEHRLRHAKRALAATAAPVKQIAFELGFRSSSHFGQWFRKLTRQTPMQYRHETGSDQLMS